MNDQTKSPAGGQGFDNSRGGECRKNLYIETLQKSNPNRLAWSKPVLLEVTPEWHFFKVCCDGRTSRPTGKSEWKPGKRLHIYELVDAARRANERGEILNIGIMGDGHPAKGFAPSLEDGEAWLRGEEGQ